MKKKIKDSLGDLKDKVVPAKDLVFAKTNKKSFDGKRINPLTMDEMALTDNTLFDAKKIQERLNQLKTLEAIEELCNKEGVSPQDLIENYKVGKGKVKNKVSEIAPKSQERPSMSNWREKQRASKCGLNVK